MQLVRDALQDGMFGHHIPVPHYTSDTIPQTGQHHDVAWVGIPKVVRFASFKEDERARYGKTIEEIEATMKDPHLDRRAAVFCYDDGQEDVILRVNRWKLPALADKLENMRCDGTEVVIAVGMKREDFGVTLHVQDLWVIELEA
jgi:DNA polymerase-3 subunit alpha